MSKLRIWRCPRCDNGTRAPSKPRRDDVRRYCLPCSEKTGRLIKRTCPALEREREQRATRQNERHARTRARARETEAARHTVDGIDLRDEFKRFCRLPALGGSKGTLARFPPEYAIRRSRTKYARTSGHAWGDRRLVVTVGVDADYAEAAEVLLHEVVHAYCAMNDDGYAHDANYRGKLCEAAEQAWPGLGTIKRGNGHSMWDIDVSIAQAIREVIAARTATPDRMP